MPFSPPLRPGESVDNIRLTKIFKCSPQGGMRRSLQTNSLVLVCDHVKSIYHDRWHGEVFHYTGMGLLGDQDISSSQNKTLAELSTNEVSAYLFEKHERRAYTFTGEVELAGHPYQEKQKDSKGKERKVWVFPLQLKGKKAPPPIPIEILREKEKAQENTAIRLTDEKLRRKVEGRTGKPGIHTVSNQVYERDAGVAEYAKRRAKGICELCKKAAPFIDQKGSPFLETHHIVWLSAGGEDTVENTVALCPNCHRKMHILNFPLDVAALKMLGKTL